jgi:hypothetical protein
MGDRPDPTDGNRLTAAIDYTSTPLSVGFCERQGDKCSARSNAMRWGTLDLNDEEVRRLAVTDFLDPTCRLGVSDDVEIRYRSQRSVNGLSAVNYKTEIIFEFKPIKLHRKLIS